MKISQSQSVLLPLNFSLAAEPSSPVCAETAPTPEPQNKPSEGRSIFEEGPTSTTTPRPKINPAQNTSSRPCGRIWLGRPIKPFQSHPLPQLSFPPDFDPVQMILILEAYEDLRAISGKRGPLYSLDHDSLRLLVRELSLKYHPESSAPGACPDQTTFIRIRNAWTLIDDFKKPRPIRP